MLKSTLEELEVLSTFTEEEGNEWDLPPIITLVLDNTSVILAFADADNPYVAMEAIEKGRDKLPIDWKELTAIVLQCEGWGLTQKKVSETDDGSALMERAEKLHEQGKFFKDEPDRIEVKQWIAVDAEGVTGKMLQRGDKEASDWPGAIGGDLVIALSYLFKELTK